MYASAENLQKAKTKVLTVCIVSTPSHMLKLPCLEQLNLFSFLWGYLPNAYIKEFY